MRFKTSTRRAEAILIVAFFAFYITAEILLFANRNVFGANLVGNNLVMFLVSFLNIVPAGIFAFAVVSVLPENEEDEFSEKKLLNSPPVLKPRVALLYTTYNDFMTEDAEYNYEQARESRFPFFIVDDSNRDRKRSEVEAFARQRQSCVLIRRGSRKGFKAGAINNWMRLYGDEFDYFFILDSDSRASADSIRYCVELARRDPRIALVQTNTLTTTGNPTAFTKSAVTIQHAYMAVVQNSMKNLGSSPYYGHNALLKIDALESIGGFIEESNEDYKTLARLHNQGYKSIYASNATTWEETPPDYFSARKRGLRWARDAVGQLGLLRFRLPIPMIIFLFYGWVTYMTNLALVSLSFLLALGFLSLQVSNMGVFAEIAGVMTISVATMWPLVSLRVNDPELNPKEIVKAVAWGTPYNVPMMAPVTLQIIRTTLDRIVRQVKKSLFGTAEERVEEFVVTPKFRAMGFDLSSVVSSLKIEIVMGLLPIVLAIITLARYFLLFSIPQMLSLMLLPLLIQAESRNAPVVLLKRHVPASAREYSRGYSGVSNFEGAPQYAYMRMH